MEREMMFSLESSKEELEELGVDCSSGIPAMIRVLLTCQELKRLRTLLSVAEMTEKKTGDLLEEKE